MPSVEDGERVEMEATSSNQLSDEIRIPNRTRRSTRHYRSRLWSSDMNDTSDSNDDTGLDSDDDSNPQTSLSSSSNDDESNSSIEGNYGNWSDDSDFNIDENETPTVLLKRKPDHEWNVLRELKRREMGLTLRAGLNGKSDTVFEHRFYGSLHCVERLELMYKLNKHKGCVNSINFHPEGNLLVSGSDDLNLVIWDWTTNTCRRVVKTDHKSNIFQSKFLYLNAASQLNIVSCARDGQVLLTQVPTCGGPPIKRKLAEHSKSAHKLYTNPAEPHVIVSAGEDAQVILSDVRQEKANRLFVVRNSKSKVPLYSVAGHPLDMNEMCVAGRDRSVMLYDRRKTGTNVKPVRKLCPNFFRTVNKPSDDNDTTKKQAKICCAAYITCAVYNYDGSEILASYNDDDIYLFDTKDGDPDDNVHGFTHFYSGHRNSATFKGVSFFGPQSEFVVSGSDCANIYIWEKKSQAIVQWMMGDEGGVVNCIECHPRFPVLATSGLDTDVKIWVPSNETSSTLPGLRETVIKNSRDRQKLPLFNFMPTIYSIFQRESEIIAERNSDSDSQQEERFDHNTCRAF